MEHNILWNSQMSASDGKYNCFFQTFAISDLNEQREQINGICLLFCGVAVLSLFSQFLQVGVAISAQNVSLNR